MSRSSSPPGSPAPRPSATDPLVLVVAGGLILGLALGMRHVQGLFLLPITMERGWTREAFGFAMAVQNLVWGLAQPFAGMIADRFGSARVMLAGLLLYALGLYTMTQATTHAAFVWSAGICLGLALSGTTFGVVFAALSRLVSAQRRGWALGVAGSFGGLGQFLLVPAVQAGVERIGWSAALWSMAVCALLALPLVWPLRERGARAAEASTPASTLASSEASAAAQAGTDGNRQSMRAAIRQACGHRGFWLLNIGFLACGFQLAFIASHLPAYLLDRGLSARDAVIALAIIALANIAGTYLCGLLGNHVRRHRALAGIYLLRTAAIALFLLVPLSSVSVFVFAAVMGFVWLGTVPLTSGLVSQVFGTRYVATLFGFVFLGHQLGSFLGVWLGGYLFDRTGSYDLVWIGAIVVGLGAVVLHWPIDDRPVGHREAAMAAA
ncbi:MFS transporter [Cupriavidus gilardii]|nr:MFS transporter [Cupriavidus gilardii]KAB0594835.1 MFS transporter [Cupriavidus gilardii]MCT9014287.1 MFS transporter [Cupriavidus gilardii]MCT9054007.1 MFS transporter [Cupriavidus gilardii]USE77337.1 MFS transporter [Cupriavidus gilardii]WNG68563.1 MFS transporter [Cupriavidus gilardii]